MTNWIPISKTKHQSEYWLPSSDYLFTASTEVLLLLNAELPKLVTQYVIAFIKNDSQMTPVVILGIGIGKNLYVSEEGVWLASYIPATVRGYPYALIPDSNGQKILCIDENYIGRGENENPIFDGENLAEKTAERHNFLNHSEESKTHTLSAGKLLDSLNLLEPWPLAFKSDNSDETSQLTGLFKVNEEVLNNLTDDEFCKLRNHGALALAYAQLFSMSQIDELVKRIEFLSQQTSKRSQSPLGELFADQDTISFENLNI